MRVYIPISFALLASTGLPKVLSAVETEVVHNHLRAVPTDSKEKEDRMLSSEADAASFFEEIVPRFSGFPAKSAENFAVDVDEHMRKNIGKQLVSIAEKKEIDRRIFCQEFRDMIKIRVPFAATMDVDITAYLTYLRLVDDKNPVMEAAKRIDENRNDKSMRDYAVNIEEGQFIIWSEFAQTIEEAITKIFHNQFEATSEWKWRVLRRYVDFRNHFLANSNALESYRLTSEKLNL